MNLTEQIDPGKMNPAIPIATREAFARHVEALAPLVGEMIFVVSVTVGEGPANAKTTAIVLGSPTWRKQVAERLLADAVRDLEEEKK